MTAAVAPLRAAPYCVANVSQLKSALVTIGENDRGGSSVDLRLQSGHYLLPAPASGAYALTLNLSFLSTSYRVSGGWNPGCTAQSKLPERATVLDGQGLRGVLQIRRYAVPPGSGAAPPQAPQLRFDTLQFANGMDTSSAARSGCLDSLDAPPSLWAKYPYHLVIEATQFSSCRKAVSMGAASSLTIRNSLFIENFGNPAAISAIHGQGEVYIVNNTFRRNEVIAGSQQGAELWVGGGGAPAPVKYVVNNVFAESKLSGNRVFQVIGDGVTFVRRNRVQYVSADSTLSGTPWLLHNTAVDPMFLSASSHRLSAASPLRDLGENSATGGVGTVDFGGAVRVQGASVDVGAYELGPAVALPDAVFGNGFE